MPVYRAAQYISNCGYCVTCGRQGTMGLVWLRAGELYCREHYLAVWGEPVPKARTQEDLTEIDLEKL
jgi:hypothetical protein